MIELTRIKQVLKVQEYRKFMSWMTGQTMEINNGKAGVFEDDFIRWVNKLEVID